MSFYTYLWLRDDGTPYYVGKGKGDRGFASYGHRVPRPKNRNQIIVQNHPSEEEAYVAEQFLIEYYGRKIVKTGCLQNVCEGGKSGMSCNVWQSPFGQALKIKTKLRLRKAHAEGRMSGGNRNWLLAGGFIYSEKLGELVKKPRITAFEKKTKELGLKPEQYQQSSELRKWCEGNRLERYIPENLLRYWGLSVSETELSC
ncbi:MAG: hypothetical protein C5B59_06560 [Bacteroidetes bacterium]|nr:MAG: hypothetical protein C5B59_06560 [Bacteroidota bacterium]